MSECIENELKFVLRHQAALETALAAKIVPESLAAGYLNAETRVRSEASPSGHRHVFAFKRRLPDGRNVEIQAEIPQETFNLLWVDTTERLRKHRYSFHDGPDLKWDVDFFKGASGTYFAMAEVEMPASMEAPPRIPEVLARHVAFAVPRDDGRFASRLLADEVRAGRLAKELEASA